MLGQLSENTGNALRDAISTHPQAEGRGLRIYIDGYG